MPRGRVLILEDDREVSNLMCMILEDEGYVVHTHPNGDCQGTVEQFRPDLILCDYMLPVRDGLAVLQRVRSSSRSSSIPFILVSAAQEACRNWTNWGVDDFLSKPFELERLVNTVNGHFQHEAA